MVVVVVVVVVSVLFDAHEFKKMEAIATAQTSVSLFIEREVQCWIGSVQMPIIVIAVILLYRHP